MYPEEYNKYFIASRVLGIVVLGLIILYTMVK